MTNKNYKNGADFERQVKKMLEDNGYVAYRTAGSHGHADVLWFGIPNKYDKAFFDEKCNVLEAVVVCPSVALIQCKLNGKISAKEKEGLIGECNMIGVTPVLAYREKVGRKYEIVLEHAESGERIEV